MRHHSISVGPLCDDCPVCWPRRRAMLVLVIVLAVLSFLAGNAAYSAENDRRPNIIIVLADDLGLGDVRCCNSASKIPTPHFDRVAREGMMFTDAHSGSAVCTPTRYGLLTGRYAWRSRLQQGVLGGLSPRLIEPGRQTVASLLKSQGYDTVCIGKWHLGLDWVKLPGKTVAELNIEAADQVHNVDYARPFTNGPLTVGFDRFFGISASLDMVPYTYLRDDRVEALPTVDRSFAMMRNRGPGQTRRGPSAPEFDAADVLPRLTQETVQFLRSRKPNDTPFFVYLPYASPHTPILPAEEWLGKSGLNPYGDFVMQQDAALGEILAALDEHGLAENTLLIVTSDNGCSPQAKYDELLAKGHDPSAGFRGTKADIFEGGHRVPFLVRWPARITSPNRSSARTICLTDLLATCADMMNVKLSADVGEDSVSFLPTLLSPEMQPAREPVVHHSINGSFAIRDGMWKLIFCRDSGGWSAPRPGRDQSGNLPPLQLYNLDEDFAESRNVAAMHPEVVARLTERMEALIARGRSTPGEPQSNAVPVNLWKYASRGAAE